MARLVDAMCNTPGITYVLEVTEHPLPDLEAIVERVLPVYAERLAGRRSRCAVSAVARMILPRWMWSACWRRAAGQDRSGRGASSSSRR